MREESQLLTQGVAFEKAWRTPVWRFRMPSLPMAILFTIVAFLVLTPLVLLILNSFQIARPGQPIVWGVEGWVKAFSTGSVKRTGEARLAGAAAAVR